MSTNENIVNEPTGIFKGILQEDMSDTVKRTGKMYCDVYIAELFSKDSSYPLTYVPSWAFMMPLKKDDKVLVKFNQEDLMFPVLYKPDYDVDDVFKDNDVVSAIKLDSNTYIIKTKNELKIESDSKVTINGHLEIAAKTGL